MTHKEINELLEIIKEKGIILKVSSSRLNKDILLYQSEDDGSLIIDKASKDEKEECLWVFPLESRFENKYAVRESGKIIKYETFDERLQELERIIQYSDTIIKAVPKYQDIFSNTGNINNSDIDDSIELTDEDDIVELTED